MYLYKVLSLCFSCFHLVHFKQFKTVTTYNQFVLCIKRKRHVNYIQYMQGRWCTNWYALLYAPLCHAFCDTMRYRDVISNRFHTGNSTWYEMPTMDCVMWSACGVKWTLKVKKRIYEFSDLSFWKLWVCGSYMRMCMAAAVHANWKAPVL